MVSEGPWPTADDPDDDTDWAVYLDDEALHPVREDADSPLVVVVHIQMTAGTSLRQILLAG